MCRKRGYKKLAEADRVKDRMFKSDGKYRRSYLCPYCCEWHITSQKKRGKP